MRYVDSAESLEQALQIIQKSSWAAVDTEADSLHHYLEKLCLVQVSVPGEDFVIDPFGSADIKPLIAALEKKFLIFHGADFDLRMLHRYAGFKAEKMFDTMIAAQYLGYDKQGLADLALKHCQVALSKSAQKADWSQRPLDERMLAYAANDTHFLKHIQEVMEEELSALGRLEWHRQACDRLARAIPLAKEHRVLSEDRWVIKGANKLRGAQVTILKELWTWRDGEARKFDRPSFKVLTNDMLLELVEWASAADTPDVALWPRCPRNIKRDHRDQVNRVIVDARVMPQQLFPERKPSYRRKPPQNFKELLGVLKQTREEIAKELNIHPSIVATNNILETVIVEPPQSKEEMGKVEGVLPWQAEILYDVFAKTLKP